MKKELEKRLNEYLNCLLNEYGFVHFNEKNSFLRRSDGIFHWVTFSCRKGTSTSENGYRVSLEARIFCPQLSGKIIKINNFPENNAEYVDGGRVSFDRIGGNFFIDIDDCQLANDMVFSPFSELLFKKALPWLSLHSSVERSNEILRLESKETIQDTKSKKGSIENKKLLNEIFVDQSKRLNNNNLKPVTIEYLRGNLLGEINTSFSSEGFLLSEFEENECVFIREIKPNLFQSVSFVVQNSLFLEVWMHIISPSYLPDEYWEILHKQHGVPPLIGELLTKSSIMVGDVHVNVEHKNKVIDFFNQEIISTCNRLLNKAEVLKFIDQNLSNGLFDLSREEIIKIATVEIE